MNEHQLTIGETTYGGLPQLTQGQDGAIMDYGNLIWTTLERAKSVQEAIPIMAELVGEYGYEVWQDSFGGGAPKSWCSFLPKEGLFRVILVPNFLLLQLQDLVLPNSPKATPPRASCSR